MSHSFTFYFGEDRCQYKSNLFLTGGHLTKNGQNPGSSRHISHLIKGKFHEEIPCKVNGLVVSYGWIWEVPPANELLKGESHGSIWQTRQGTKGKEEEAQTHPEGKEKAEARKGTAGRKETHHHPWIGKLKNTHRAGQLPGSILFGEAADAARFVTDPKPASVRRISTIPDRLIHNSSTMC